MVEQSAGRVSIPVRREVLATFAVVVNEGMGQPGLQTAVKKDTTTSEPDPIIITSKARLRLELLPLERQFGLGAETFYQRYRAGEMYDSAGAAHFANLCFLADRGSFMDGNGLKDIPYQLVRRSA